MDTMTRNQIFMENEELISRVMRRNYPLLRALRLEWDDVRLCVSGIGCGDAQRHQHV